MPYYIAAISNSGGAPEQAYRKMQNAAACPEKPLAEMFKFEVPSLMVGTLDSLMTLSDELGKTDQLVEAITRKIEKSGAELTSQKADFTVGGVPPNRYIQQFAWDYAKYPNRRPLKELVALISGGAQAIDEELKQLGTSFQEKTMALSDAKRRKGGNLMVADLNDALNPEDMRKITVHNSEYLKTVFVAFPSQAEDDFEKVIYDVGKTIVGYGGPDWSRDPRNLGHPVKFGSLVDRFRKKGSPVVPGSVQKVTSDKDSCLYVVTILKSQYQAGYYEGDEFQAGTKVDFIQLFEKACRDKRFVVRDFEYDPSQSSRSSMQIEQLQTEVEGMRSGLSRWTKTHYGEAFVAWMHIKVVRVFVESVLRYGLPVDFTAVLYKVPAGADKEFVDALDKELAPPKREITKEEGEENQDDGGDDGDEEYHEFVLQSFEP
mmetsp:Transcript_49163/g.73061  ORF Transcript_49163/g.73061 Transcript_49163/m.73061 type:complete len:431 (-) Transcript_49163:244-1536(-)|eukprot:CAMPEP_0195523062 /NCGR_PEP_ID=MMETSP0794_2-20130614/21852_1 /TAXON_ID=515487 /ORGANISM="Stephanopyxis turris, Strain CCMP 815" /LENGTH=430 /DNA_ID=CAMNT_0040652975 /DNA_START=97 /DNA_END=1389 /DNA_ORIENTATION=+